MDNSELVDTQFLMDYLNSISRAKKRIEADSIEALLGIFAAKCAEEST